MTIKLYVFIWAVIGSVLGFEYWSLNFRPAISILHRLQTKGIIQESFLLSPDPGRPMSLWLGWIGLALMVIMNLYSMRKRFSFMRTLGKLSSWLDFHVFCGLVGPTFILFHCNLKVRGLVGISFWSMVISFSSGVIGRYFYVQMLRRKNEFVEASESWQKRLDKYFAQKKLEIPNEEKSKYMDRALVLAGGVTHDIIPNPFSAMIMSIMGDMRLSFSSPKVGKKWPPRTQFMLAEYAVNRRRAQFLESFQKLMGYWHAFHFPFAVFMYVAAVIHVAAALIFGV